MILRSLRFMGWLTLFVAVPVFALVLASFAFLGLVDATGWAG